MDLIVRKVRIEDSRLLVELQKNFCLLMDKFENGEFGYSQGYYNDDSYKNEVFEYDEERPLYVAEVNGAVVGFVKIYFEEDYIDIGENTCIIFEVYVIDEYRKKGLGKILVEKAVEIAKENAADSIYAIVMLKDENSKEFFSTIGFEKEGEQGYIKYL